MKVNPSIYREYDIRGRADVDYDASFAEALGRAYGSRLLRDNITRAAVGCDCRVSSPGYHQALKQGILSTGVSVVDIGECPTPLLYFAVHFLDLMGGIQVTGSHNPPDQNGFKICVGKSTIHGKDIQELRQMVESGRADSGSGSEESYRIIPAYIGYLEEQFGRSGEGVKVVVDSGNGTGGPVGPPIYRAIGSEVEDLYSQPDGRFPHHHPDPTVEDNMAELIERVRSSGAQLGIAFDGDADRIGAVDDNGRIVWGDELMVVFARDILAKHPGATVVSEVKCSQRLYDDIASHGGKGIMWKVGHSLLKAKMRETGALLGGEMSGHLFFADRYFGYDDAIYAGARLIEVVARSGRGLADLLSDLPPAVSTPELRIECPDEIKFQIAEKARERFLALGYEIVDVDGVRVKFDDGWGLIRASNTQPVLVTRFEASSEESLRRARDVVEEELDKLKRELVPA